MFYITYNVFIKAYIMRHLCLLLVSVLLAFSVFAGCKPEEHPEIILKTILPETRNIVQPPPREFPEEPVRKTAFEGSWYLDNPDELTRTVKSYLNKAKKIESPKGHKPRIIISPHAGYVFCWATAAKAYKQIEGYTYETVILIGPCHRFPMNGVSVYKQGSYKNCLGSLKINSVLAKKIIDQNKHIFFEPRAHAHEHSLEIQLPFLQVILGDVPIVPILIRTYDTGLPRTLAHAVTDAVKGLDVLVVISTDLSHFCDAEDARTVDTITVDSWKTLDPEKILETSVRQLRSGIKNLDCTMCGELAVLTGFEYAKLNNIDEIIVTGISNSADVSEKNIETVGYASAVLFSKNGLSGKEGKMSELFSEESKKELLKIAREAVEKAVDREPIPADKVDNPQLQEHMGCFVTLKNKGRLRGCIGRFEADQELYKTVREMALASSIQDSRFFYNPITPKEIPELTIEISVLTPMKKTDDPEGITLGVHGIYIKKGLRSGTFLPQVATETGWSLEEFYGHCCQDKAGLPWDAWKTDPEVEVLTYEAIVFSEKEF